MLYKHGAPHLQNNINRLESIVNFVLSLRINTKLYENIIEIFKIFNQIIDDDLEPLLNLNQNGLRNNCFKANS